MAQKNLPELEILLGIVSPLGSNRDTFIKKLENEFSKNDFDFEYISITDLLFSHNGKKIPKPLDYFIKMQICSQLRLDYSNAILIRLIIESINTIRNNYKKSKKNSRKKIVYLIDQLKNVAEHTVLSHIYGLNYIQLSLFSNQVERDATLKNKFHDVTISDMIVNSYTDDCINILDKMKIKIKGNSKEFANNLLTEYCEEILPDATHRLMEKDFIEIDDMFTESKSGQQISELFHRSHYFINLDLHESDINRETDKFMNILLGRNQEYPTQDEFGMSLAYQASVRSNFPGNRHIGASIISEHGEVISVASIRAPTQKSSNPTLDDRLSIQKGYNSFHKKIKNWKFDITILTDGYEPHLMTNNLNPERGKIYLLKKKTSLEYTVIDPDGKKITDTINKKQLGKQIPKKLTIDSLRKLLPKILKITSSRRHTYSDSNKLNSSKNILHEIKQFIGNLLDFHPCTHAEIAAIIDAAKLGVSVRNATLYTTTFPCHLCAKDIINAGIKRVVYLEAYPKSRNRELYPNLIDFDPKFESELIPFNFYWGIGPMRFIFGYSLENCAEDNDKPPLLRFEIPEYYEQREKDVRESLEYLEKPLKNKKFKKHLDNLLKHK